jgi:hypothetical protein
LRRASLHATLGAMSVRANPESLRQLIQQAVPDAAFRAFCEQVERCQPAFKLPTFLGAFTATARTLGRKTLDADDVTLTGAAGDLPLAGTSTDCAGRMLLLYTLAQATPQQLAAAVQAAYDEGDSQEKLAVMRALPLLPEAERFVSIALDIGRCNELDLFSSLAVRNPYPSRHYNELAWNKLYMKAVFLDVPLEHMLGVEERNNAELSRMALEYVEQQESAGRRFPNEIWSVVAAVPAPGAIGKLLGYLSHAVADLRLGAAAGLERAAQPRTVSFLRERASVETDERVRATLARTLQKLEQRSS